MMNSEIKYSDVLKIVNGLKGEQKITVIRNMTLEPVFGDYLKLYDHTTDIEYTDVTTYLTSRMLVNSAMAIIILNLAEINPHLYDNVFTMSVEAINDSVPKIEELLKVLIEKLHSDFTNVILFSFERDFYANTPNHIFSFNDLVDRINKYLFDLSKNHPNFHIIDISTVIGKIGADNFYNIRGLYSANAPFSMLGCNALAYEAVKYIRMIIGKTKKCLVLDCDNVLWGGIISEDGINEIWLSRRFTGKPYRDFQREIVRLYKEGILICLCSKNNENDVFEVFDSHPDMLLKKEHIAAYRINWNDKAGNIRELSRELNISLDDMVFMDDSEYETNLVSKMLPQVTVIRIDPEKPHSYINVIKRCDLFVKLLITEEDGIRGQMYREQSERVKQKEMFADIEEYHKSLKTETQILSAEKFSIPRIAELSQRTNQFNLSARRYTVEELLKLVECNDYDILYLKASDVFGDMGIICACVIHYTKSQAIIEAFMLSCRAFCRGFETLMLSHIKERIKAKGFCNLYGIYNETAKNQQFKSFYNDNEVTLFG